MLVYLISKVNVICIIFKSLVLHCYPFFLKNAKFSSGLFTLPALWMTTLLHLLHLSCVPFMFKNYFSFNLCEIYVCKSSIINELWSIVFIITHCCVFLFSF